MAGGFIPGEPKERAASGGRGHRLATRLFVYALVASALTLIVTSGAQLYMEYERDVEAVNARMQAVIRGHGPTISASAFRLDREQLRVALRSALLTEDVRYLELRDATEGGLGVVAVGHPVPAQERAQRQSRLTFSQRDGESLLVGTLTVHATLAGVRGRLEKRALFIAASNLVTVALVSLTILAIFRQALTRPLERISDYLEQLRWDELGPPLELRGRRGWGAQDDELARLVESLNRMQRRLREGLAEEERAAREKAALESQLQQAQRLETVGTLASGIAHEFNNILTPLISSAELALQDVESGDVRAEDLELIVAAGERARTLVRQMQTFGRHVPQDFRAVSLREVFERALRLIRAATPANVTVEAPRSLDGLAVRGDALQLEQVLMNIAINASHAIGDRTGTVVLDVDSDGVRLDGDDAPAVRISVVDDGAGMPQETVDRIFEPFFTTKEAGKGTGLGMSVVYGIVRAHGGTIDIRSEVGVGTSVYIVLPLHLGAVEGAMEAGTPVPGHGVVLVVDDEITIARTLSRALIQLGYQARVARSGMEALERVREGEVFDLILTDLTMPRLGGLELAEGVRKARPGLPIILMTGGVLSDEQRMRASQVVDAILHKPLHLTRMSHTLGEVLSAARERTSPAGNQVTSAGR